MNLKRTPGHVAFALVLMLSDCALAQPKGTQKQVIALSSGWEFRQKLDVQTANPPLWRPAQVPGLVHLDLLRNQLIPDPFYRDNEAKLQWIENAAWEYRTSFQASRELIERRHVEIVLMASIAMPKFT